MDNIVASHACYASSDIPGMVRCTHKLLNSTHHARMGSDHYLRAGAARRHISDGTQHRFLERT
jgi:hypothetical protein